MNVHGFELTKDWAVSNIGFTAIGTKGGKKYFLKKYGQYKVPVKGPSLTEAGFRRKMEIFEDFKGNRMAINEALSSIAGPGGNIVLPSEWFVDGIEYTEATEFVPNVVEIEDFYTLPMDDIKFAMITAANAMAGIHRKGIVHSDIKLKNVLTARNSSGKVVAKIIDFDRAYFADKIRPDEIGGDQSYMSPELTLVFATEMSEEYLPLLSTKSDVFSLGVVFHNYLTGGKFPEFQNLEGAIKEKYESGSPVYCGAASLSGGSLVIDPSIKEPYMTHLLAAMLQNEAEDRPTAQEVLEILKTKRVIDLKPNPSVIVGCEASGASTATRPVTTPTGTTTTTTTTTTVTPPAPPKPEPIPEGFCAPWPEHDITMDEKALSSSFKAMEQLLDKGIKKYKLHKAKGGFSVYPVETLVRAGFAKYNSGKKAGTGSSKLVVEDVMKRKPAFETVSTTVDTTSEPWEEDSEYKFDMDKITANKFVGIKRATKGSAKCYVLEKADGTTRFMTIANLKLLGYAVKK